MLVGLSTWRAANWWAICQRAHHFETFWGKQAPLAILPERVACVSHVCQVLKQHSGKLALQARCETVAGSGAR